MSLRAEAASGTNRARNRARVDERDFDPEARRERSKLELRREKRKTALGRTWVEMVRSDRVKSNPGLGAERRERIGRPEAVGRSGRFLICVRGRKSERSGPRRARCLTRSQAQTPEGEERKEKGPGLTPAEDDSVSRAQAIYRSAVGAVWREGDGVGQRERREKLSYERRGSVLFG